MLLKNRKVVGYKDEYHDELFYGILKEEWNEKQNK